MTPISRCLGVAIGLMVAGCGDASSKAAAAPTGPKGYDALDPQGTWEKLDAYAPWAMHGGTGRRAFLGRVAGPATAGVRFSTNVGDEVWGSPTVAGGENIFVGLKSGGVVALRADGTIAWKDYSVKGGPAYVAVREPGGMFASAGASMFWYNAGGVALKALSVHGGIPKTQTAPVVTAADQVFQAHDMSVALALLNPEHYYEFPIPSSIATAPAAYGQLVLAGTDGTLRVYALDGQPHWEAVVGVDLTVLAVRIDFSPVVGASDGYVREFGAAGKLEWSTDVGATPLALAMDINLSTLVRTEARLTSLRSDGTIAWAIDICHGTTPIATDIGGSVYVGCADGTVRSFTGAGDPRWTIDAGSPITSGFAIGEMGTLYAGTADGHLVAWADAQ